MSLLECLSNQIETTFREHPHRFFTEHDIHSELTLIAKWQLEDEGGVYARTREGLLVNRIHHEYPTPFRCHMKGVEFRLIKEDLYKAEKLKNPRFRARRGWIDFVVLNPEFVSSNKLSVVSGKRYKDFRKSLRKQQYPALDLAVEVVYFPTFDKKPHIGMMQRKVNSTIQDYKKLVALMEFTYPDDTSFCKEAAMMLFSNTIHEDKLRDVLSSFPLHENVTFLCVV